MALMPTLKSGEGEEGQPLELMPGKFFYFLFSFPEPAVYQMWYTTAAGVSVKLSLTGDFSTDVQLHLCC